MLRVGQRQANRYWDSLRPAIRYFVRLHAFTARSFPHWFAS